VQTLYLVVTTLIMGLELLTVVNATLCAILGPGLALRGPDGSMHNAVNGMMTHYKFTFACFTCGLLCFHISALLYAWMQVLTLALALALARTLAPALALARTLALALARTLALAPTLSLTCFSSRGTWRCPCPYCCSTSSGRSGATSGASSSASSSNPPASSPEPSITTRRRRARPSRPPTSSPASSRHATYTYYKCIRCIIFSAASTPSPPPVPVAPTTRPTTEPTLSSAILYAPYTVRIQSPLQEREEQLKLQQQYASLPESVKASMGIATPCGEAGPSSGAGGMH
jgi:hypothetical protein